MARSTTKAPQPKHDETPAKPAISSEAIVSDAVPMRGKAGKSFTAVIRGDDKERLSRKAQLLGEVSQRMAELADLDTDNAKNLKEAEELSGKVANLLYQGQVENLLSKDEVSAELGRQFGFVPKRDGTPGKTPAGQGATIRRRLVRGVAAHDFVENGSGGAFFDGFEPEWTVSDDDSRTVSDIVEAVNSGEMTVWTAYDLFQKIKSHNAERTELAFDAKRISGIAQKLGQSVEASANLFLDDPNLAIAYATLRDAFEIIDARAGELMAELEAAA